MTDYVPTVSNPAGRPKGSKNEITLLKIAMESSFRSKNMAKIAQVLDDILEAALAGDKDCRKLVWSSVMSKSTIDANQSSGEMPQITLRVEGAPVKHVEVMDIPPSDVIDVTPERIEDGKAD